MNEALIRARIADAASTVDGVTVSPWFNQTTKPGSGYVRFDRVAYPNKFGGTVTWQVFVILPPDLAQAEKWLSENITDLYEAINPEIAVQSIAPVQLALGDVGTVPAVVIQGQREQE